MRNRAIFIDRDGTLNEEVGYVNHLSRFRLFPFAAKAIKLINDAGWRAIIVTNQAGIARSYFTEDLTLKVHDQIRESLKLEGAYVDDIYYCPHHPSVGEFPYLQDCDCRKPKPGMLKRAADVYSLDLTQCFVVGDRFSDIMMAHSVGANGVMVLTGYGRGEYEYQRANWACEPDNVAENLLEAVMWALKAKPCQEGISEEYLPLSKVLTKNELQVKIAADRANGKRITFANGCFDLLHVGHLRYLRGAKRLGDVLVVGINSDRSARLLKGEGRPIIPELERAEIIAAIECVDYVTIFDELTVKDILLTLKPDFHAKGTDYTEYTVPEQADVLSYGGRVAIVGDPKTHFTNDLLRKVKS